MAARLADGARSFDVEGLEETMAALVSEGLVEEEEARETLASLEHDREFKRTQAKARWEAKRRARGRG